MSSTKRRKIDPETMSNASGRNSGSNNASTGTSRRAAAASGGGGGPGSRGGHSAATASRAAAAVASVVPSNSAGGTSSVNGSNAAGASTGNIPGQAYVPVLPLSALPVSALSKYALHYGLVPPEPLTVAQATFPTPALPLELKLSDSYTIPSTRAIGGSSRDREGRRNGRSPFISTNGARAGSLNPVMAIRAAAAAAAAAGGERSEDHSDADNNQNHASSSRLSLLQVNNNISGDNSNSSTSTTPINSTMAKSRSSSHQGVASAMQVDDDIAHTNNNAFASYGLQQSSEWTDPGEADALELRGMNAFEGGEEQLRERLGLLARTHWDKLASVKEAETVVNFAYAIRMRSKILKSAPMV